MEPGSARMSYFERYGTRSPGRLDEIVAYQRGFIARRIHLVASASYPFDSVLRALAEPSFVLPAEGMPGARYLPGAEVMDLVEELGEELVLELFGHPEGYRATLQPHSGTQANQIVFNAVLGAEDKVLSLSTRDGGHISHTVVLSRRHPTIHYGVREDGQLDYEQLRAAALEHRPRLIVAGGSSLPRAVDFETCAAVAHDVGALLHADVSHTATFVAAGLHPGVFPMCDFVTFNTVKNLRGPNNGVLVYRSEHRAQVHKSIFPTTQGGANETGMLGQLACFLEWRDRDITAYAKDIVETATTLGNTLVERGIPLVSAGTDCHMLVLDLRSRNRSGADVEVELARLGVLANRNLVPGDVRLPTVTSGLRIGATNLAILGYEPDDLVRLGSWIATVIDEGTASTDVVDQLIEKYQGGLIAPVW
jgi:glycine hydroxymethyltransferase